METLIDCPQCNHPVNSHALICDKCGVTLALAAALAEQDITYPIQSTLIPMAPEVLVPRLGDFLIEKGKLIFDELQRALHYQQEKLTAGEPCLIGQALLELGYIDRKTLDESVTVQILQLQSALRQANQQLEQRVQERTNELQQALRKLTELSQLKSNFISNISHELRTPLTHIKGYLDLLSDSSLGPLTTQQSDALSVLLRAEERLEKLIEDLIHFSLAARGELTIDLTTFQLADTVQAVIIQSAPKARSKQITLRPSLQADLPPVRADEDKISWVLVQLVDNAIKFSPPEGKVEIQARYEIGLVTVYVVDTGIGIPEEQIQEIFEPFHQLDGSAKRRYGGTGLGLTMVRRILDAHGIPITVRSRVGEGTCFEFTLPVAPDK